MSKGSPEMSATVGNWGNGEEVKQKQFEGSAEARQRASGTA